MTLKKGVTVWFTGLSGAGKTTICLGVAEKLRGMGYYPAVLDGDLIRRTVNRDLGFSRADREQNMRYAGSLAHRLTRRGVIVLVSLISPYRDLRNYFRMNIKDFIEVYANAPLAVCEARDVKGLYRMAREGLIRDFTGIDSPYERPLAPEVECLTDRESVEQSCRKVLDELAGRGYIDSAGSHRAWAGDSH